MKPTRLYYGTTGTDEGELELISVSIDSPNYNLSNAPFEFQSYRQLDFGTVLFEHLIPPAPSKLIGFFDSASKLNWMIEMPNDMTFMFQGYVESIEQSLSMGFGNNISKFKVRIAGPVTAYYDGVASKEPVDISDIFSKKVSRAQSKVLASALERACSTD